MRRALPGGYWLDDDAPWLVRFIADEASPAQTRRFLPTRDIHQLYAKAGFATPGGRTSEH